MSSILNFGVAIPRFQIEDNLLDPVRGRKGKMNALAYVDEDIITLAYEAGEKCLENVSGEVDAIFFATTSPVFKDRYHASFLGNLLGLPEGIMAIDLGSTARSGTDALILADKLIEAGIINQALVLAADLRFPPIGEETKVLFGHAASALLLSRQNGLANIQATLSRSSATAEAFKYKGSSVEWDPRFAKEIGFKANFSEYLKSEEIRSDLFDSVILNTKFARDGIRMLTKAGFDAKTQMTKDQVVAEAGFTGAAHALLRLIHQLEMGTERFLLLDYKNGLNAVSIKDSSAKTEKSFLNAEKTVLKSYQDYLTLRKAGNFSSKAYKTLDIFSSEMIAERESEQLLHLVAWECTGCGTAYLLRSTQCKSCNSKDFKPKQLQKTGTVYSLTSEYYFPSSFSPINMVVIDLEGGGRITVQQTDDMYPGDQTMKIGSQVRLVLRKMMENDAKPNYFWKAKLMDESNE